MIAGDRMNIEVDQHPLLALKLISCVFPEGLNGSGNDSLHRYLEPDAPAPIGVQEGTKTQIRDLLRVGGFKPSGRSKPASEYLIKAAQGGFLGPINTAVDVCNAVSLHSGIPISVVDVDRLQGNLSVRIASPDTRYVFNASDQEIDVSGLLCLHDSLGACANAVKDSQRTKTNEFSTRCLYLFWASRELQDTVDLAFDWAQNLLKEYGASEVCEVHTDCGSQLG